MNVRPSLWRAGSAAIALALCAVTVNSPAAHAADRSMPACAATDLSAKVTGSAAGMSQPAVYVTVTNTTSASCSLKGYPTITRAWTKKGSQDVTVTNGAVMNAPQVKPTRIVLKPGGKAWFAIGAATAYDPPLVTFTRVTFSIGTGASIGVGRLALQATAPTGKPFPLGVTAFAPGVGTSQ